MIRCIYSLICEKFVVSAIDHQLSAINFLPFFAIEKNEIRSKRLNKPLTIVLLLEKDIDESAKLRYEITKKDIADVLETDDLDVNENPGIHISAYTLSKMLHRGPGEYSINVMYQVEGTDVWQPLTQSPFFLAKEKKQ